MGLLVGLGGDGGDKPGVSATVAYKELAKVFHCISSGVLVCRLLQGVVLTTRTEVQAPSTDSAHILIIL